MLGDLQGPGQVAEVHGAAEPRVGLQQAHDDGHGRLVVAGAAGALLRVDHVHADVGVLPCRDTAQPALSLLPSPQGFEAQGHQRRDTGALLSKGQRTSQGQAQCQTANTTLQQQLSYLTLTQQEKRGFQASPKETASVK